MSIKIKWLFKNKQHPGPKLRLGKTFLKNFTAQNNLLAIILLMGIEIFWFRHNLWLWRPFKEGNPHLLPNFGGTFFKPP